MGMSLGNNGGNNRRRRGARSQPFSEINVTPMVDVMLVLLVIFMVAAPMMTTGVTVDLPEAKSSAVPGQDEPVNVSVKSDGKVYINETLIAVKDLKAKLEAVSKQKKDTRIFVRGDKTADYGKIMAVVGEINAAGFNKVALLTDMSGDKGR